MPTLAESPKFAVLPARAGLAPKMPATIPHLQIDQLAPREMLDQLVRLGLQLAFVDVRQSRMASADSRALFLPDEAALGPVEAFIDAHEFCHIHPASESSIHLTLPAHGRDEVVRLGWGVPHPLAEAGIIENLMTIYAPRDLNEVDAVLQIIRTSYQFARGQWNRLAQPAANGESGE